MSSKPQVQVVSSEIRLLQTLQYGVVSKNLCAYRYQVTAAPGASVPKMPFVGGIVEGLADLQAIEEFLAGGHPAIRGRGGLTYESFETIERAAEFGLNAALLHPDRANRSEPGVFSLFESGQLDPSRIVEANFGAGLLFDLNGEPLPTAIYFDYIKGGAHNMRYNLEKALAVLSKDPRVRPTEGTQLKIALIPFYNIEGGRTTQLSFRFRPTQEDIRKLWAYCKSKFLEYPGLHLQEAIFELDMLGLREAGAALHQGYHDTE